MSDATNPNILRIPADYTKAQKAELIAANPGAVFVDMSIAVPADLASPATVAAAVPAGAPAASVTTEAPTIHPGLLSMLLKIVRTAADIELPILLPGVGLFVDAAVDAGVDLTIARLDGAPATEKWTVERITAARANVAEPTT